MANLCISFSIMQTQSENIIPNATIQDGKAIRFKLFFARRWSIILNSSILFVFSAVILFHYLIIPVTIKSLLNSDSINSLGNSKSLSISLESVDIDFIPDESIGVQVLKVNVCFSRSRSFGSMFISWALEVQPLEISFAAISSKEKGKSDDEYDDEIDDENELDIPIASIDIKSVNPKSTTSSAVCFDMILESHSSQNLGRLFALVASSKEVITSKIIRLQANIIISIYGFAQRPILFEKDIDFDKAVLPALQKRA